MASRVCLVYLRSSFFFNDTPPTEIYTLSLHDALPIFIVGTDGGHVLCLDATGKQLWDFDKVGEEAMVYASPAVSNGIEIGRAPSELQSQFHLVCRLLLEKKKINNAKIGHAT